MPELHLVILAAGKGRRMHSGIPKVLHRVAGLPLIAYVLRTASTLRAASSTLVIGHLADQVCAAVADRPDLRFVVQQPQLGTAHALIQVEPLFAGLQGTLVMLSGDVPLLRPGTLERLVRAHQASQAAVTVLTAVLDRPYGYGRIVRTRGRIARIVEERDASPSERGIHEINSGIYAFDLGPLFGSLRRIAAENAQREYYLPDLVSIYRREGLEIATVQVEDPTEIRGINSRTEMAEVNRLVWQAKNEELMGLGVTIEDPATTYVGPDVSVGMDTVIHPGVHLEGRTQIGAACEIHSGVRIVDSTLGDRVIVRNFCVIEGSHIADDVRVGPFARLRPESDVGQAASIGNFVELKKTSVGAGSKANHLTYLGDATIGARVNVGAGTITCNYDGERKHPTVVEDEVFIGSDSQLVAPVRVGKGAYVAAGSSITEDVPAGALAIARAPQVNKDGWVAGRGRRDKKGKHPEKGTE